MEQKQVFYPPRRTGIFLHALLLVLLAGGVTALMIVGFSQPADWTLVLYLIGALLLFALMPVVAYRGYALFHASYTLERDGLHVRWGLRSEDLPMTEVIWVRPASDLVKPLRLPPFSVPGAILGDSFHEELGKVEFIASSAAHLVIISAINKTLVLSPQDPEQFCNRFQRIIEMGSLAPIEPSSAVPVGFFRNAFKDPFARTLILTNLVLLLLLLIGTSILIPFRQTIPAGLGAARALLDPVPASRLILQPILALMFTLMDLIAGFYAFRRQEGRILACFLWSAGILTTVLLTVSVLLLFLAGS